MVTLTDWNSQKEFECDESGIVRVFEWQPKTGGPVYTRIDLQNKNFLLVKNDVLTIEELINHGG